MKEGVAFPGLCLAPSLDPVVCILQLNIPTFIEPLLQQKSLAKKFIGALGIPLSAREADGTDNQQQRNGKAHGGLSSKKRVCCRLIKSNAVGRLPRNSISLRKCQ
jgi:hypothetical protein